MIHEAARAVPKRSRWKEWRAVAAVTSLLWRVLSQGNSGETQSVPRTEGARLCER